MITASMADKFTGIALNPIWIGSKIQYTFCANIIIHKILWYIIRAAIERVITLNGPV